MSYRCSFIGDVHRCPTGVLPSSRRTGNANYRCVTPVKGGSTATPTSACKPGGCSHFVPYAFADDEGVDLETDLCQHCHTAVCVGCRIALSRAVIDGNLVDCQQILESGVDPNYPQGPRGRSPLHEAAAGGYSAIIHALVDAHADVNLPTPHDRWTPLHEATQQAHDVAVVALLERNANPALQCSAGHTALDLARQQERVADIWS